MLCNWKSEIDPSLAIFFCFILTFIIWQHRLKVVWYHVYSHNFHSPYVQASKDLAYTCKFCFVKPLNLQIVVPHNVMHVALTY